jgi:nitrogen fixation/metabolism regulation signal transduction histidine kinase
MSNYVPVIDASGNNYAYLNIPYFTSQTKLKQEISNFLVTIINLNAFIFLIAGIVALFITNRITHSFSVISEQMKKINLGSHNEAIEWRRDDEIGELVMEYNKMVNKLDHSASVLAKTEREGAWKEMARQVAHEIKNPLTPMKLSMQFLQKSIESNAPNVKELSENVARTLIEQIDHLSQIANDFSQFANIGDSRKERFDMNDTLRNVLHLHAVNDKMEIIQQLLPNPVMIDADKTHINRLFTNLVLNAIQSVPDTRSARIEVSQSIDGNQVLTKISDNGNGINETIQSKIFTPNFTTKTSGTGLGLAMCKRIVEQAEGEIWFETVQDVGTSFFVKLPLAN